MAKTKRKGKMPMAKIPMKGKRMAKAAFATEGDTMAAPAAKGKAKMGGKAKGGYRQRMESAEL